ncbi:MAG: M20 family metallopeptidase [Bacillota bacterium]|nr:M20 family metallopeptidase [Bacillota bacterium]
MKNSELIQEAFEQEKKRLIEMARAIHRQPETGGNEVFAVELITGYLENKGFKVWRRVGGLKTAFMASYGGEGFHVGFCSEYDALPEIGHGCGHNLIGIAGVAAGVALAAGLDGINGRVSIIGTPDEEDHGGKVDLVRTGVFDDVDAALMFHPGCSTRIHVQSLACCDYQFIFHGKNAHAACEPWEGRNALDGVIQTFNGINALRQHLKDDVRIHGIISEGGLASNVIPDRAVADFCIRAIDNRSLGEVVQRVIACARGAAIATGTELEVKESDYPYDAMLSNRVLADVFAESLEEAGYNLKSPNIEGFGSIDMGNVSRVTPSIHPLVAITEEWVPGHTKEFSALCDTDEAYEIMLTAARAMALTGLKVMQDPDLQKKIKDEFNAQIREYC